MKIKKFLQVSIHLTVDERKTLESALDVLTEMSDKLGNIKYFDGTVSENMITMDEDVTRACHHLDKVLSNIENNVIPNINRKLKKLDIGVLQRGISAPQVIRKQNRKAQIAQSRKEPFGSFSFWWRACGRTAPKFHYTTSRRICQVKNCTKMHELVSRNSCILTIDFSCQV